MAGSALTLELPGRTPLELTDLVLDFNGTLSLDGLLVPQVRPRLARLAKRWRVTVLTADTFGKAARSLAGLPLKLRIVATGKEKLAFVRQRGTDHVAAIGNGRNDVAMLKAAALGIAVLGPEGAAGDLLAAADVVVRDVREALDLLAHPLRLKATLRD